MRPSHVERIPNQQQPYFHHGRAEPAPLAGWLRPQTRYLCAAAYVDEHFADRVIGEVVEDEHRAVAPSYDFDLEPVVRHCFRARRLWLVQNAVLTVLLAGALYLAPAPTLMLVQTLLLVAVPVLLRRHAKLPAWKAVGVGLALAAVLLVVLAPLMVMATLATLLPAGLAGPATPPDPAGAGGLLAQATLLLVLLLGALLWSRYTMLQTLTTDLAPGAEHRPPPVHDARVEQRLRTIATAQHGNVVLHAGPWPFLGTGTTPLRAWSIVIDLRPHHARPDMMDGAPDGPVDPVELNRHVKRRLAALRSELLPERQRISGLVLRDQVVASGLRWQGYPLVDGHARLPYAYASPRAVEAIMRHPQASARHFLRVTTGTAGKEVVTDDGTLLAAEDQEVQVSAFVHIAVEGGLLYVEFVSTVLGGLLDRYHEIDTLPTASGGVLGLAAVDALKRLPVATLAAPVNLVRAGVRAAGMALRMNRANRESLEAPAYGYGARASVRVMASEPDAATYVQRLDAHKYSRLIEHRVHDAVLDYLADQEVDVSEYRQQMNVINLSGVIVGANAQVNGNIVNATNSTVTQHAAVGATTTGK